MPNQVDPKTLPQTGLFADLDDTARTLISEQMRQSNFEAGQLIFSKGDPGDSLYVVLRGRVRLSVLTPEGRELSFTHATTGNTFGEIAMLDAKSRTADATAITAVDTALLKRSAFLNIMQDVPAFTNNVILMLCDRLRQADIQLEGVALQRIEVRLARYLEDLVKRQWRADPTLKDEYYTPVDLGISQGELALLLGASRPKVNTALGFLEDKGAIERDGNHLRCNAEILAEIAEGT